MKQFDKRPLDYVHLIGETIWKSVFFLAIPNNIQISNCQSLNTKSLKR